MNAGWKAALAGSAMVLAMSCGGADLASLDGGTALFVGSSRLAVDWDQVRFGCLQFPRLQATFDDVPLRAFNLGGGETVTVPGGHLRPDSRCVVPTFEAPELPKSGTHVVKVFDESEALTMVFRMNEGFSARVVEPADGVLRMGETVRLAFDPPDAPVFTSRGIHLEAGGGVFLDTGGPISVLRTGGITAQVVEIESPPRRPTELGRYAGSLEFAVFASVVECRAGSCEVDPFMKTLHYDLPVVFEVR